MTFNDPLQLLGKATGGIRTLTNPSQFVGELIEWFTPR
jgi:hypothetical protein